MSSNLEHDQKLRRHFLPIPVLPTPLSAILLPGERRTAVERGCLSRPISRQSDLGPSIQRQNLLEFELSSVRYALEFVEEVGVGFGEEGDKPACDGRRLRPGQLGRFLKVGLVEVD